MMVAPYLVPDVHLGEVLHHIDDVLGAGHGETPGDEVVLHVDDQERPPGREDALEPVDGLTPLLQLLHDALDLILHQEISATEYKTVPIIFV